MKNKLLAGLLTIIILISAVGSVYVSAESDNTADKAQNFIGGIVAFNKNDSNIQNWINGSLSQNPANGSEWYILSLCQYGNYNFTTYKNSLLSYLENNEVGSASSRLKFALALSAMGSTDSYIGKVAGEDIGKQGIMSYVFGLHLLNNVSTDNTKNEIVNTLLKMQKSDGGWAIMGDFGDNDVTAKTVQALAPYYKTNSKVKTAVDKALTLLSNRQKADGDYASYGIDNPESTAQVLVALSSLGIDSGSDSRFIKKGKTLIDGIEKYRLADGSFCHQIGKSSNANATMQVFYAMVSYIRLVGGKTPFYILDNAKPVKISNQSGNTPEITVSENTVTSSTSNSSISTFVSAMDNTKKPITITPTESNTTSTATVSKEASAETVSKETSNETKSTYSASMQSMNNDSTEGTVFAPEGENALKTPGYKFWAILIIVGSGGVISIVLLIFKKKNYKNFIAVLLAVVLGITVVCVTNFSSADNYYKGEDISKENAKGSVTMTIRCDTVVGKGNSEYIPENGIILDTTEFQIEKGDTAYDILIEAAKKYKIQVENEGNAEMAYISGINYLYEFDYGDLSGWVYHINGEAPSVGCSEYILEKGDKVEWLYTCDLGNDVK